MVVDVLNFLKSFFSDESFLGLLLFCAVGFFIWWSRGVYEKVKSIENLPCSKNAEKIENILEEKGSINISITKIETSILYLQKSIENLNQSLQANNNKIITDPFTQTNSPISITAKGYDMIKRLGVESMFEKNWDRIRTFIKENTESKNPYDIQQFCLEQAVVYPEKFLRVEEVDILKMDAYKAGFSLTSYMKVVAVLARDRYFEENNIDVLEVDRTAP